jgi:hypothetical protein
MKASRIYVTDIQATGPGLSSTFFLGLRPARVVLDGAGFNLFVTRAAIRLRRTAHGMICKNSFLAAWGWCRILE